MGNIIEVKNLTYEYVYEDDKREVVLEDVSLSIKEGEFVALIGHNGSGKSSLIKHFNGILMPTKGDVLVDGMNTKDQDDILKIRQRVGMVFQNPDNQIVATVVEEDVAFGPENLGYKSEDIRRRVDKALETVGLSDYKKHASYKLSGGQKQRLAIAGILAMSTRCIVLDEPTAMLDPVGRKEVIRTIKRLNREKGITVVLITHYMDEIVDADRIVVMDGGRIEMQGKPSEVFSQVERLHEIGLEVPQSAALLYRLRCEGYDISSQAISFDESVQALTKLLQGAKH